MVQRRLEDRIRQLCLKVSKLQDADEIRSYAQQLRSLLKEHHARMQAGLRLYAVGKPLIERRRNTTKQSGEPALKDPSSRVFTLAIITSQNTESSD